jgi:mono/diheme cytochrome c family protein
MGLARAFAMVGLSLGGASLALCAALAKGPADRATPMRAPPSEAALFAAHCGICHSEMGSGTLALAARLGRRRALLATRRDLDADGVRFAVRNGVGSMPAQTRVDLSDADLARVIIYLTKSAAKPRGSPAARLRSDHE